MSLICYDVKKFHESFRGPCGPYVIQDQQGGLDELVEEVVCRPVFRKYGLLLEFQVGLIPKHVVIPGMIELAEYGLCGERLAVPILA